MTDYAGEGYRFETGDPTDYDGTPLTPDKVDYALVEVYDPGYTEQFLSEHMEYNEGTGRWQYVWASPGPTGGTYKGWIIIMGLDGVPSIEGPVRIRLKDDARDAYTPPPPP